MTYNAFGSSRGLLVFRAVSEHERGFKVLVIEDSYELAEEDGMRLLELLDADGGSSPRGNGTKISPVDELSQSERRVLRYLPTNLSRPDIARELYVSVNTVNTHVRNIYSKLDASNRAEAVERARQLHLLAC